ncbi:MAG TPA: hypothetical protein DEH78_07660 [Solibacterales bacterium]|nr:hypothetical protein [Bryobacterales bacterium]
MLQVPSQRRLDEIEHALCHAAEIHGAQVVAATRLAPDLWSYTLHHAPLQTALVGADPRAAAFLPCRITARRESGHLLLEAVQPHHFGTLLKRQDLEPLLAPLEVLLRDVMEAAARRSPRSVGATEWQMNVRGAIPHRIDCHGTQIEELAGTGHLDAPGG